MDIGKAMELFHPTENEKDVKFDLDEMGMKKAVLREYSTNNRKYAGIVYYNYAGNVQPALTMWFEFYEFFQLLNQIDLIVEKCEKFLPKKRPYSSSNPQEQKAYAYYWRWLDANPSSDGREYVVAHSSQTFWSKSDAFEDAQRMRAELGDRELELDIEGRQVKAWDLFDQVKKLFWYLAVVKINVETMASPCEGCMSKSKEPDSHRCMKMPDETKIKSLLDTFGGKISANLCQNPRQLTRMIEEGRKIIGAAHIWAEAYSYSATQFISLTAAETKQQIVAFFEKPEAHQFKMVERIYLAAKERGDVPIAFARRALEFTPPNKMITPEKLDPDYIIPKKARVFGN